MNTKVKQNDDKQNTKFSSYRVSPETKIKGDQILDDLNSIFETRRIGPDRLLNLLFDLFKEEHKKLLQREARTGDEVHKIWWNIYSKENGEISFNDFKKIMGNPSFFPFMKKHLNDFEAVI